ncbi:MFS transporter [Changpingibacter yushuensis]|uniref:MFS transporter n=1 Tax=Changpingibacter yushuensis TaxID=2758440 RepID=UPI001C70D224|nr:MFS transporter [Changpingibacter yushuensis]
MMVGGQRRALSRSAGFASGAVALAAVFLASGTPIPLYARYRVEYNITDTDLAITTVAYLAATALSLLMLGRLSDHLGRKRVGIAAVLIATCALVVLMNMHTLPILILGRCLQGAACGMASTALASWVIDLAPASPGWLPAFLTGTVPPFALPVGAMLSGALAEYGPASRTLMFQLTAAVLVLLAVLLMFSRETVVRRAGAMRSLVPRVHVPEGRGRLLFAVGAAQVTTWSFSGFYQAFSPAITVDHLGTSNPLVIAVVFSSVVVLSPLGGLLAGGARKATALRAGLGVFVVAALIAVLALHVGVIGPFLAASFLAGIALGAVSAAGLATLLQCTAAADRAGLMATVYLISYSGAAVPSLIACQLAKTVEVSDIATGYAVLVTVAALTAALTITRRRPRGESRSGARTLALSKSGRSNPDRSQQVGTLDV